MSDIRDLYQQLILDHGRHPRNKQHIDGASYVQVGNNRLCGDKLVVYANEQDGRIEKLCFEGEGCAISMASASLMTEALQGKTLDEAQDLLQRFLRMLQGETVDETGLGKLMVLHGVCDYPARVKCASLSWRALEAALAGQNGDVTTE